MSVLEPVPAAGFAPGAKLLLTDGRMAFQARYDAASGRIGVAEADGTYRTYRPGPALDALLRAG